MLNTSNFAHYEQFLLFPQCFQMACFPGASKGVIEWEWVKSHSMLNDVFEQWASFIPFTFS